VLGSVLDTEDAIYLPSALSASDPESLFRVCSLISAATDDVVVDAGELKFIDPFGLAVLRAALETQPAGKQINWRWMSQDLIDYFARMDFFQELLVEGLDLKNARLQLAGEPFSCVELIKVTDSGQSEETASRLVRAMMGADADLDQYEPYRRPIEYALKELLENALSHARREGHFNSSVWVACQHFTNAGTVRLSIVDNGCGFLATLRNHAQLKDNKTHAAAIQAALIERVSCNRGPNVGYETDSQNQGVGLTMTAKIAKAAEGHLVVASGDAWLHTTCEAQFSLSDCAWNGVAISFECQRDKLPEIDISALLPAVEGSPDVEITFE